MAFVNPTVPNLADFTTYCQDQGVTTEALPANSPFFQYAFNSAMDKVLIPPDDMPAIEYVLAVYNWGLHWLLKIAPDQTGSTYFATIRQAYKLLSFTGGVVVNAGDQGTNASLAEPEFLKGLTISALDLLKTPWGQMALDYQQQYGPNIVGMS